MRVLAALIFIVSVFLTSCNPSPEKINYGEDVCHFCQMSIVDPRYGSEIVTTKGKVFKFDAVECMINYMDRNDLPDTDIAFMLVNTYSQPESLNEARECTYLISKKMPSPMGMYITPFINEDSALVYKERNGGTALTWSELNSNFNSLPDLTK